jgi:hypothetical protein
VEQRADGGADARSTTDGGGLKTLGRCLAVESTVARVQGFPRRWRDEEDDGKVKDRYGEPERGGVNGSR